MEHAIVVLASQAVNHQDLVANVNSVHLVLILMVVTGVQVAQERRIPRTKELRVVKSANVALNPMAREQVVRDVGPVSSVHITPRVLLALQTNIARALEVVAATLVGQAQKQTVNTPDVLVVQLELHLPVVIRAVTSAQTTP